MRLKFIFDTKAKREACVSILGNTAAVGCTSQKEASVTALILSRVCLLHPEEEKLTTKKTGSEQEATWFYRNIDTDADIRRSSLRLYFTITTTEV